MKVEIRFKPATSQVEVWFFSYTPEGTAIYEPDGSLRGVSVEPNPAPSLTLDRNSLVALVEAGGDVVPPNASQARHLDDAITVRDKLFSLLIPRDES